MTVTVGKHTAANGSTVHPLVAEALARRSEVSVAAHGEGSPARKGSPGWPEPPPGDGGGLGWPADPGPQRGTVPQDAGPQRVGPQRVGTEANRSVAPVVQAAAEARRGWRRLFGASPAA